MNEAVTRPFVPFILNGRVYRWLFAPWKNDKPLDHIVIDVPMKVFKAPKIWEARQMHCTFVRKYYVMGRLNAHPANLQRGKVLELDQENCGDDVGELCYICNSPSMYYDSEGLPVTR